jgi:hypothetical protein
MSAIRYAIAAALTGTLAAGPAFTASLELNLQSAFNQAAGARPFATEIVAYTPDQNTVLATIGNTTAPTPLVGVQVLGLGNTGALSERGIINFSTAFGATSAIRDASSTAVDPLGRGFGAVSLIPTANGTATGKVGFFDYRSGSAGALVTVDVGFHPDSIVFSADGTKLYVANEGEFTSGGATDAPGSISIIDLSSINVAGDLAGLTNAAVQTYDFQASNLGTGVSLSGLRFNDRSAGALANPFRHVEPEYITQVGGKLLVALQENNAIAEFDLATNQWTAINSLGTITNTIDASDRDGAGGTASPQVNDLIAGLPMPDNIASFTVAGSSYVVTANEGDFRVDDADRARVADLGSGGRPAVDPTVALALDAQYGGNFRAAGALGRLRVSTVDGDIDGDGDIDVLTATGTRGFSIWDATSGALVADSGSLETLLLTLDPARHNINFTGGIDARSPDKGPEPEGLTVATIGGIPILFIGMERQGGLLAYDLSDPTSPQFLAYINGQGSNLVAPESLVFVNAADSPTGGNLLLVGYEGIDGTSNFGIGVYSVVPVPAAAWLFGGGLAALGFLRRKSSLAAAPALT